MADSIETNKTNLAAQYPDAPDDVIQAWAEIKYNEDTYAEEFGWKDSRIKAYPELAEQIDMLFHDITAGKLDETGELYKTLKKVKNDNPKPSE